MRNEASTWLKKKDEISSQFRGDIFEFCDPELFQETLQNSEVTSSPNCCYDKNSSYAANLSIPQDIETKFNTSQDSNTNTADTTIDPTTSTTSSTNDANINATTCSPNATNDNYKIDNLSMIYDSQEEIDTDISASIDFSTSPPFSVPPYLMSQQDQQYDYSSVQPQMPLTDSVVEGFSHYPASDPVPPLVSAPLSSVFDEDGLSSMPSYVPLSSSSPSCSFLGPTMEAYMSSMNAAALPGDNTGIFASSVLMASKLQPQDLEFQADNGGIFGQQSLQRGFNPDDFKVLSVDTGNSTSLASEIPMGKDPNYKVGKLSAEERKEKIHKYMKKRNERNFTKKIKYACRKTLADRRPRVRGRFARNDDYGENHRPPDFNDEYDAVVVKEEEDMVDSSDIFAHISGVNSFKHSYHIQSWV